MMVLEEATRKAMTDSAPKRQPLTLLLATQNANKRRELLEILQDWHSLHATAQDANTTPAFLIETAPEDVDIAETGATFAENAGIKAKGYWLALQPNVDYVLAEDSGLIVDALDGTEGISPFPGVISKRWLTPELQKTLWGKPLEHPSTQTHLNDAILKLLGDRSTEQRSARYCCAMAILDGKTGETVFEAFGEMPLQVAFQAKGDGGFGYDPIMLPISDTLVLPVTVAGLSPCLKNRLSHRGKAFQQVLSFLDTHGK